jgi:subtilisin-like proprotein convertase family protein
VAGLTGFTYHVSVTINATHTFPSDLQFFLVNPTGIGVLLMANSGGSTDISDTNFTIDDCAPRSGFSSAIISGSRFRPTNRANPTPLPPPAPQGPYRDTLSDLNFVNPNGTWSLYVVDTTTGDVGQINSWTLTFFTTQVAAPLVGGGNPISCTAPDYDGDGRTDVAVYRESTGQWFISQSGSNGATAVVNWGAPNLADTQVPGDYDGDGITDIGVYRQATGEWFIRRSSNLSLMQVAFGAGTNSGLGDTPVPGDYDGDGQADLAVYRTTTGQWFIRPSSGQAVQSFGYGYPPANDRPARR